MSIVAWLIGGMCFAAALIAIAMVRAGSDHDHNDGDGW